MMNIATVTLNPAFDVSFEVDRLFHTSKMRGDNERHAPGGGGINVARVFVRLGGNARCHYLAGGATGAALDRALDQHEIVRNRVAIAGETRVSTSVFERTSRREYRFVTDGPEIAEAKWRECEAAIAQAECDYLVASGSLPRGVPDDFYARIATAANNRGIRFVLDSSGRGLAGGLAAGGVFLVKPSVGELRALTGQELESEEEIAAAARAIVERGQAKYVAVTMGRDGGILASADGVIRRAAIPVEAASAVGAGDSCVAAMVYAFARGRAPADAFAFGMAGGAAAVLTPGTDLARARDIRRLYEETTGTPAP
ncbi:1-phosphofructokinase family hexose kinase [Erythrobacter sp.]|uniref:1-phosphofructokinase family hexose kinase n=1 Tax=Erythrobacter sp. TaxID=1042 RepID=UPI001425E0A4|nr:1-phosphofructokinase family hexose kinase [Erythrobacter sp.]QIQ87974.1 MAG: 1-phosphofructokinase family hexose kinase [Erythrobacter sp.]